MDKLTNLQRLGISFLLLKERETGSHYLNRGRITFGKNFMGEFINMYVSPDIDERLQLIFTLSPKENIDVSQTYMFKYDEQNRMFRIIDEEELKVVGES